MNYVETAHLIANKMAEGKKLSEALALVYNKRELVIPSDEYMVRELCASQVPSSAAMAQHHQCRHGG